MSKYLIQNYPLYYELFAEKHLLGTELVANQLNKVIVTHYYIKMLELMVLKTGYLAVEKYSLASSMKKKIED